MEGACLTREAEARLLNDEGRQLVLQIRAICEDVPWADPALVAGLLNQHGNDDQAVTSVLVNFDSDISSGCKKLRETEYLYQDSPTQKQGYCMEWLPLEVMQMIAKHLSAKDLASCCATSFSWRNKFDQDCLWKERCNQENEEYLTKSECIAVPPFVGPPEMEGSRLSPICQWRLNFLREQHLLNNWRTGRCQWGKINPSRDVLEPSRRHDVPYLLFYKEDFLFYLHHNKDVELWDVRYEPVPYVNKPCRLTSSKWIDKCLISNDKLVIVQGLLVSIFKIDLLKKSWPLKYQFVIDEGEEANESFPATIDDMPLVIGNYFIGWTASEGVYIMHIWDIEIGEKLKTKFFNFLPQKIINSKTSDDLIIYSCKCCASPDALQAPKCAYVFSLTNFQIFPLNFIPAEYCFIYNEHLYVYGSSNFYTLNYKSCEQKIINLSGSMFDAKNFQHSGENLLFIQEHSLKQINILTGKITNFIRGDFRVVDYKIFCEKFIMIDILKSDCTFKNDNNIDTYWNIPSKEIWQISETHKKIDLHIDTFRMDLVTNKSMTKLAFKPFKIKAYVLSFW